MKKDKLHQLIIKEAAGFDVNIEKATVDNNFFRKVLFTTDNMQLVVMSVQTEIGAETHDNIDQFIRVESGTGKAVIGGRTFKLEAETAFIVPRGSRHNVVNTGKEPLKIYTVYTPSNHAPGTIHKTKEDADQAELSERADLKRYDKENLDQRGNARQELIKRQKEAREKRNKTLDEAGFEGNPKGWDKASLKKYMNTFTKQMKGGVKATGFFDKCVEKIKDKMDNPEGFCASLKDESYGSTGWRGKDKSPKEVSKDVKKAKFKVESDDAINQYLDFLDEGIKKGVLNEGAVLPNELINLLEYDEQPNWIGYCFRTYDGSPRTQIKCLQAVKEYAAANPFYQYRIDRYIDRIMDNWDGGSEAPYPTQNPDEREINLGTTGRTYEDGYTNRDDLEPGMLEDLQISEGLIPMQAIAGFAIGRHIKRILNPTTSDIIKANPGKVAAGVVGSIVLATIIISGVNEAYKKYISAAGKACKDHDNKDECMQKYTYSGTREKINILQKSKDMCSKAKNPKKCEKKVDEQIIKVKEKYKTMMNQGFLEYAKGLNEDFFDAIKKQYEKDKAACLKQFPNPEDKKHIVPCIRKRKAAWINSMKFKNEMMETGMATRIPSGGLDQNTTEEDMQSDDLQERMGMKSRIPSSGLKDEVEEGQSEADKKASIKRGIPK